tara:strand:+ start:3654 stop:3782 length:129 start_codon:yes stop_codon:yes gene_type:complete
LAGLTTGAQCTSPEGEPIAPDMETYLLSRQEAEGKNALEEQP